MMSHRWRHHPLQPDGSASLSPPDQGASRRRQAWLVWRRFRRSSWPATGWNSTNCPNLKSSEPWRARPEARTPRCPRGRRVSIHAYVFSHWRWPSPSLGSAWCPIAVQPRALAGKVATGFRPLSKIVAIGAARRRRLAVLARRAARHGLTSRRRAHTRRRSAGRATALVTCRKTAREESPGSTEKRCRITSGGGDPRESATENRPPRIRTAARKACGDLRRGKGETVG